MGGKDLYELKCTSSLTVEHKLQLACYAYIFGPEYTYRLLNLLSGECLVLKYDQKAIASAVELLVKNKLLEPVSMDDEAFLDFVARAGTAGHQEVDALLESLCFD